MDNQSFSELLDRLKSVTDEALDRSLRACDMSVSEWKYHTAFSCFGVATKLRELAPRELGMRNEMPHKAQESIKETASIVFLAYTALVYMRSEHLERGLDKVPDDSPLTSFRDGFRMGCQNRGEDSVVQHLRNSLCHGTFDFDEREQKLCFKDRNNWELAVPRGQLIELCRQVFRFFEVAFRISQDTKTVH